MNRLMTLFALILLLFFPTTAPAQTTNAALSGTVSDASSAVVPGAAVTAQNIQTGIVLTTTTNEAGVYNAFNTPQWGNPNTDINSTNFGRITNAGGNRIIVLEARINF